MGIIDPIRDEKNGYRYYRINNSHFFIISNHFT
nr:hypothetical protein [Thomasclavelia ramosa]